MNTLQLPAIITSLRAKTDGSLGISLTTPELSAQAKTAFFELQNKNVDLTIKPTDYENAPEIKVDKEVNPKTPSKRLASVLYKLWEYSNKVVGFDEYYKIRMETIIDELKGELDLI